MVNIQSIRALEILDSRGNPTLKTYVELENGLTTWASVPSGASTGSHEAHELRDHDTHRFSGNGELRAVRDVEILHQKLKGTNIADPKTIDQEIIAYDGTRDKSHYGANTLLSVSLACFRAYALSQEKPLWKVLWEYYFSDYIFSFPRLMINMINGGVHADWNFDFQEFMIIPDQAQPSLAVRFGAETFHKIGHTLKNRGKSILVGDEGGYSPDLSSNEEALDLLLSFAKPGGMEARIGIDAAASEFYDGEKYVFKKSHIKMTPKELSKYYMTLKDTYDLLSIEDPFAQDDFEHFAALTKEIDPTLIVGDDLYTTNTKRIQKGIELQATNTVLIKPNQIGTLYEVVQAIHLAKQDGQKIVISHRSGETDDAFIADLAYACGADFFKAGSMSRYERLAKYNRLLEIEKFEA